MVLVVLLPLIPALLIYRFFPKAEARARGPFKGLTVNISGAFAAYFLTLLAASGLYYYITEKGVDSLNAQLIAANDLVATLTKQSSLANGLTETNKNETLDWYNTHYGALVNSVEILKQEKSELTQRLNDDELQVWSVSGKVNFDKNDIELSPKGITIRIEPPPIIKPNGEFCFSAVIPKEGKGRADYPVVYFELKDYYDPDDVTLYPAQDLVENNDTQVDSVNRKIKVNRPMILKRRSGKILSPTSDKALLPADQKVSIN